MERSKGAEEERRGEEEGKRGEEEERSRGEEQSVGRLSGTSEATVGCIIYRSDGVIKGKHK